MNDNTEITKYIKQVVSDEIDDRIRIQYLRKKVDRGYQEIDHGRLIFWGLVIAIPNGLLGVILQGANVWKIFF